MLCVLRCFCTIIFKSFFFCFCTTFVWPITRVDVSHAGQCSVPSVQSNHCIFLCCLQKIKNKLKKFTKHYIKLKPVQKIFHHNFGVNAKFSYFFSLRLIRHVFFICSINGEKKWLNEDKIIKTAVTMTCFGSSCLRRWWGSLVFLFVTRWRWCSSKSY